MDTKLKFEFENYLISRDLFKSLVEGVFATFTKNSIFNGNSIVDIVNSLYGTTTNELTPNQIIRNLEHWTDGFNKSICIRAMSVGVLINTSRTQKSLTDLRGLWVYFYKSLCKSSGIPIYASLGSQSFLSIPLYSNGMDTNITELLRLHFWDISLHNYHSFRHVNLFSIHSHQFHTTSYILKGNITNELYQVQNTNEKDDHSGYCYFRIEWDESKEYKSNLKKSFAVNTNVYVNVTKKSSKSYFGGQSYEIKLEDFHSVNVDLGKEIDSMTSTLFFFDANIEGKAKSEVIGPARITRNEIIRENNINPYVLIEKLNSLLLSNK